VISEIEGIATVCNAIPKHCARQHGWNIDGPTEDELFLKKHCAKQHGWNIDGPTEDELFLKSAVQRNTPLQTHQSPYM